MEIVEIRKLTIAIGQKLPFLTPKNKLWAIFMTASVNTEYVLMITNYYYYRSIKTGDVCNS